jgi:hypothetical protein
MKTTRKKLIVVLASLYVVTWVGDDGFLLEPAFRQATFSVAGAFVRN